MNDDLTFGHEVLHPDGTIALMNGGQPTICRAAASIDALRDEADGLSVNVLPWRDANARESQARRIASDRSLDHDLRLQLVEHVASTPVLDAPPRGLTVVTEFVGPPDWSLAERLGDDFWDDERVSPAGWLCAATVRTEDGAAVECSAAKLRSADERETMVKRIAQDNRLTLTERRLYGMRVARTPLLQFKH